MAQYYTDFSEGINGWDQVGGFFANVATISDPERGTLVRFRTVAAIGGLDGVTLVLNEVGDITTDAEVVARWAHINNVLPSGVVGITNSVGDAGYWAGISSQSPTISFGPTNGSRRTVTTGDPVDYQQGQWMLTRIRLENWNHVKTKTWREGDPEPDWQLEVTDPERPPTGFGPIIQPAINTAVHLSFVPSEIRYDVVGVGLEGVEAPLAFPSSGGHDSLISGSAPITIESVGSVLTEHGTMISGQLDRMFHPDTTTTAYAASVSTNVIVSTPVSSEGNFSFPTLPAGVYHVWVEDDFQSSVNTSQVYVVGP